MQGNLLAFVVSVTRSQIFDSKRYPVEYDGKKKNLKVSKIKIPPPITLSENLEKYHIHIITYIPYTYNGGGGGELYNSFKNYIFDTKIPRKFFNKLFI